jgi:hypothetical protein
MGEMEDRCARLEATLRHIQVVLLITWVATMVTLLLVWMSLSRQIATLRP